MPGIVGIIGDGVSESIRSELEGMVSLLRHESFYVSGTEVNAELGVGVGWACHPGSYSDCLPVWNEAGDICLVWVGEHYSDPAESAELKRRGHVFSADGASALVHLYEEHGMKFLERLNGWFSGVLMDLRQKKTLLFNDRYGLSKLHVHEKGGRSYFTSEAKVFLRRFPKYRELDPRGLGEFIASGCVMEHRTLFSGLKMLPGASVWTFSPNQAVRRETYFNERSWEEQSVLGEAEYQEAMIETWDKVLPRYFRGKERVGVSLTGGVDSRMVLACVRQPEGSLPCYTFGGPYRDCRDVKLARAIAAVCKQPYSIIPVGREFQAEFPSLARRCVWISDGCMDVSGSIDVYVQQGARRLAPARVTGTYGGEILRRLTAFKPVTTGKECFTPEVLESMQSAADTYAQARRGHRLSFTAFRQTPWHMCSKYTLERSQLSLRMPYYDNEIVRLSYRAPERLYQTNQVSLDVIARGNPALERIATDRGLTTRRIPGMTQLWHACQQFTFKAEYAYDYGMPQWLAGLDHCLAPLHLERIWLGRHKFHHFRVYYRDALAPYVKEVLLDPRARSRPYLDGARLERVVLGHTQGWSNYTLELHKLLSLELIHRLLLEGGGSGGAAPARQYSGPSRAHGLKVPQA